jgi:hypothetical protein
MPTNTKRRVRRKAKRRRTYKREPEPEQISRELLIKYDPIQGSMVRQQTCLLCGGATYLFRNDERHKCPNGGHDYSIDVIDRIDGKSFTWSYIPSLEEIKHYDTAKLARQI